MIEALLRWEYLPFIFYSLGSICFLVGSLIVMWNLANPAG